MNKEFMCDMNRLLKNQDCLKIIDYLCLKEVPELFFNDYVQGNSDEEIFRLYQMALTYEKKNLLDIGLVKDKSGKFTSDMLANNHGYGKKDDTDPNSNAYLDNLEKEINDLKESTVVEKDIDEIMDEESLESIIRVTEQDAEQYDY